MKLSVKEIATVVGAKNEILIDAPINKIEFDSRLIQPGDLFLPLKGARDGHDFIPVAFENGALITFAEHPVDEPHLLVDDALTAFQKLAAYYLEKTQVPVVAVTGSNGKTTTKDMIAAVLSKKFKTYKTQGNHNNEIGLPYTVLAMPDDTEMLVLEMGMDHPGDIDFLSELAKPELAVITLIGEAHLEFMGSRENIAKGKMGITAGLHGELIAPADKIINPYIPENQKISRFGAGEDLYVTSLVERKEALTFTVNFLDESITLPAPGRFNADNAMLAAYVGTKYGVAPTAIKEALETVELTRNRTEWKKAANGADILSDVYNANPTAMKLILETFQAIPKNEGGRKLVVLADMLELGPRADELHMGIAESLDFNILDEIFLFGEHMGELYDTIKNMKSAKHFRDFDDMCEAVQSSLSPRDQILLKGSNSMNLASLIELLEKNKEE
ncbi:UDP-N-acetylmuramoyl-tripeptide--D-alanyl-D-alanine ligase [Lactococcus termiticola]|nr:UDP-N-acetylmuramoyl-tripeptide--D-alanyl-D-alanine ligase [Lactococcus termiticola]